jgi:hypothetical protein
MGVSLVNDWFGIGGERAAWANLMRASTSGLRTLQADVSDDSLRRVGNLDFLDANELRTTVAEAAHRLDLGCKRS